MAKYYVKYRNKMLITSTKTPEDAAVLLLSVLRTLYVSSNDYIYVDERGFRTSDAEIKFDVLTIMSYITKGMS
jgi:hypothetical protein